MGTQKVLGQTYINYVKKRTKFYNLHYELRIV
jgi:hypothetical protein